MAATTVGGDGNCGGTAGERQPLQPEITKKKTKAGEIRQKAGNRGGGGAGVAVRGGGVHNRARRIQ